MHAYHFGVTLTFERTTRELLAHPLLYSTCDEEEEDAERLESSLEVLARLPLLSRLSFLPFLSFFSFLRFLRRCLEPSESELELELLDSHESCRFFLFFSSFLARLRSRSQSSSSRSYESCNQ